MSYNRTIASCDSVDVVLRCPKTLGPVGLVGASEVRFLLAPRASGFKCLMWRAAYSILILLSGFAQRIIIYTVIVQLLQYYTVTTHANALRTGSTTARASC